MKVTCTAGQVVWANTPTTEQQLSATMSFPIDFNPDNPEDYDYNNGDGIDAAIRAKASKILKEQYADKVSSWGWITWHPY